MITYILIQHEADQICDTKAMKFTSVPHCHLKEIISMQKMFMIFNKTSFIGIKYEKGLFSIRCEKESKC